MEKKQYLKHGLFFVFSILLMNAFSQTNLFPYGSTWDYYNQGNLPNSNWFSPSYTPSGWSTGIGEFGFGDGDEATTIGYGPDPQNKYITVYFRKQFNVTTVQDLSATVRIDDAAVVYFNGQEVFRNNLPTGTIGYSTLGISPVLNENTEYTFTIPASLVVSGNNLLSVEIHQAEVISSDLSFDAMLTSLPPATTTGLFINELMAANASTYPDNMGNNNDWIEIKNTNSSAVSLLNYYITDNFSIPTKHQLTGSSNDFLIPAGGFLTVWASGEPYFGPKHLNFKLSSNGETVYIFAPNGTTLVDSMMYPELNDDVSYGNENDNNGLEKYFIEGTPNATNAGQTSYLGITAKPVFAAPPGFYPSNFNLAITAGSGASIYYSTDGTDPSDVNSTGVTYSYKNRYPTNSGETVFPLETKTITSQSYVTPIPIYNNTTDANKTSRMASTWSKHFPAPYMPGSPNPLVNNQKARVIRAQAFRPGYIPSKVITGTYFVNGSGVNDMAIPVMSLTTDERNLFKYNQGTFTPGEPYDNWWNSYAIPNNFDNFWQWTFLLDNPQVSQRHPMAVEFFEPNESFQAFETNAAFEIKGSISTTSPKRSMAIYFKDKYGKSNIDYPLFENSGNDMKDFKTLSVRSGSNDDTRIIDFTNQDMASHLNFQTQCSRPSALYINGEYWGLYDVKERYNSDYFDQHFGLAQDEIDFLNYIPFEIHEFEAVEGDLVHLNATRAFFNSNDLSSNINYQQALTMIDEDNLIDYYIANIFFNNNDWPYNNDKMYRKRVTYDPLTPKGHDGRWRHVMSSTEGTHTNHANDVLNSLDRVLNPTDNEILNATLFFRKFMQNATFKRKFINRFADQINTAFSSSYTQNVMQNYLTLLTPYMDEEVARWRISNSQTENTISNDDGWFFTTDFPTWQTRATARKNFFVNRPQNCRNHIQSTLTAGVQNLLTLNVSNSSHGYVHVNTISIVPETRGVSNNPYPWTGIYFRDNKITLTAIPKPGYIFSHWVTNNYYNNSTDPIIEEFVRTDFHTATAIFIPDPLFVCNDKVLHYFDFNVLPGGDLSQIGSNNGILNQGQINFAATTYSKMNRSDSLSGSNVSLQYTSQAARSIELFNPLSASVLIVDMPSTGYGNLKFTFDAERSLQGAEQLKVYYNANGTWLQLDTVRLISNDFTKYVFNVSDLQAFDNENLKFKIVFQGPSSNDYSGKVRIDNLALKGIKMKIYEETICSGSTYSLFGQTFSSAGNYSKELTTPQGCDSLEFLRLSVLSPTTVETFVGTNSLTASEFQNVNYQWISCPSGADVVGETNMVFNNPPSGQYSVEVSNNQCSYTSECVGYFVGNEELAKENDFALYPNPFENTLNISIPYGDEHSILILDLMGRKVFEMKTNNTKEVIDFSYFEKSTYIVVVDGVSKLVVKSK